MARAIGVIAAAEAGGRAIRDTLLLDCDERRFPRGPFSGLRGTLVEMALPQGNPRLRPDDCLVLDDGDLIEILARPEPLIEIRAADTVALARLAWLLGDHHIEAELSGRRLRVRRTASLAALLTPHDAKLIEIDAPFEPEGGAYEWSGFDIR